eukprot:3976314-Alexandrium_andersonii.AAC.1
MGAEQSSRRREVQRSRFPCVSKGCRQQAYLDGARWGMPSTPFDDQEQSTRGACRRLPDALN